MRSLTVISFDSKYIDIDSKIRYFAELSYKPYTSYFKKTEMPQHKSSIKRVRQDKKRRIHNRALRSKMRTLYKKVMTSETKADAEAALNQAVSYIDRMAVKGIVHKNNAANKKSNLVKHVNSLS